MAATMADAGFGPPFMAAQYGGRVQNKALAGLKVLSGARRGLQASNGESEQGPGRCG